MKGSEYFEVANLRAFATIVEIVMVVHHYKTVEFMHDVAYSGSTNKPKRHFERSLVCK
jgi:hypothetical protein